MELDKESDSSMENFLDEHPVYAELVDSITSTCVSHRFKKKDQLIHWLDNKQFNFDQYVQKKKRGIPE